MSTASQLRNERTRDKWAAEYAAFVPGFSITILRQVKLDAR
jgi:hypothetical protein